MKSWKNLLTARFLCESGALLFLGFWLLQGLLTALGAFQTTVAILLVLAALVFIFSGFVVLAQETAETLPLRLRWGWIAGGLLLFSLAVAGFYIHPSERILGGNDEGIYTNTAVSLARTGRFDLPAPVLNSIGEKDYPAFLQRELAAAGRNVSPDAAGHWRYHIGLFVDGAKRLLPQFPPGYPILLGSAYDCGGLLGLRFVNLFLWLMTSLALARLVGGWFGGAAALAAFGIYQLFPIQLWAAQTLFAEPGLQWLWLAILWAVGWKEQAPARAGIMAGLALGLGLLVKIDALFFVLLWPVLILIEWRGNRKFAAVLAGAGTVSLAVAAANWTRFNRFYCLDSLQTLSQFELVSLGVIIVVGIVAILTRDRWLRAIARAVPYWKWLVAAGVVALAVAGWLRANPAQPDYYFFWPLHAEMRSFREETLVRLAWYWQPWGLLAVILALAAGPFYFLKKKEQRLAWIVGIISCAAVCYDLHNNPIQPYAMRRFVPFALPLMVMSVAGGIARVPGLNRRKQAGLCMLVAAVLIGGFIPVNDRMNRQVEFIGMADQIRQVATQLPSDAIVIIPDGTNLSMLAMPLEFMFDRHAVTISTEQLLHPALGGILNQWRKEGYKLYLLAPSLRLLPMPGLTRGEPVFAARLASSYLDQRTDAAPEGYSDFQWAIYLLPIQPAGTNLQ